MDPAEHSEAVSTFASITGATPDQARFFLESSGWDLSTAMDSFYETGGVVPEADDMEEDGDYGLPPTAAMPPPPAQPAAPVPRAPARGAGAGRPAPGNIRGFGDFNAHADDDSDDDEGNEYFTGGEKSGMMVQDPSRRPKPNHNDDIEGLFEKLRQSGATVSEEELARRAAAGASGSRQVFTGVGRTLGSTADAPEPQAPVQAAMPPQPGLPTGGPPTPQVHTVTFYNNGFTVDDGPLRMLDDPANRPFLNSIEKEECPDELKPADRSIPVEAKMVWKRNEDYVPPPEPKYKAFSGGGNTLGSSSSSAGGSARPAAAPAAPARELVIDDKAPVTSLQLRLHDGTRMVAKFNHTHTIQDIRQFINQSRPDTPAAYQLMTSFPPKELTDLNQTIADAGLLGAVVLQKL